MITDCHIHIQPMEMFKPHALELTKKKPRTSIRSASLPLAEIIPEIHRCERN